MQHVCNRTSFTFHLELTEITVNTNSKHLELYSILGEYDNAGFPLAYCLLSTANAVEIGKRTRALGRWAQQLRDKYAIKPVFVHVDKDMAEIGMTRNVWKEAKIQLCWWHHITRRVQSRSSHSLISHSDHLDVQTPRRTRVERTQCHKPPSIHFVPMH